MTSKERAEKMRRCLYEFTDLDAQNKAASKDAIETYAGDLIADLKHLCYHEGVNFYKALWRGNMHFTEELHDEGLPVPEEADNGI